MKRYPVKIHVREFCLSRESFNDKNSYNTIIEIEIEKFKSELKGLEILGVHSQYNVLENNYSVQIDGANEFKWFPYDNYKEVEAARN